MQEQLADIEVHSDAADQGWGGIVSKEFEASENGEALQGIWTSEERSKTIAFRELRALPLVIQRIPRAAEAGEDRPVDRQKSGGAPRAQRVGAGEDLLSGVPENGRGGPRPKSPCCVDKSVVVHIARFMDTASQELVPELRVLREEMQE